MDNTGALDLAGHLDLQTQESLSSSESSRADSAQLSEWRVRKLIGALVNVTKTFTDRPLRVPENRKETENNAGYGP